MKCIFYSSILILFLFQSCKNSPSRVKIITSQFEQSSPSQHGLEKIVQTLETKKLLVSQQKEQSNEISDYYILAGLSTEENQLTRLLKELNLPLPKPKEALLIHKTTFNDKPAILICGADEVGLMYALLDVAKRISFSKNPATLFEYVVDANEAPDVKERCVSIGTFQRQYFEQRLYDTVYWEKYFDMMAENRLNQFILMFGYKNNQYLEPEFTAPVYPNFFNIEEYPYIKMSNVTDEDQQKNREALKTMIALAHERGIEFGVGLWDQIARNKEFRAIVRDDIDIPDDLPANIIWGLSKDNLIPYTKVAMREFFQTFPEIDLVQFRMHWESGVSGEVALKFWKEIFEMLKEERPNIKIEARAKNVPDETLYDGVATGADFRVATKHWMEHMGQPFHPTHINTDNQLERRHGYADLLRYPKKYEFKWRVWTGGTTRALLWGDPEWVKTFAENSHLYDAAGFEFNEPLYFKMNGQKHDAQVFDLLQPDYQYYTYEFERYWHYYQLMGRIAYNPETPSDIWEMEFYSRFGKEAGTSLMKGLHQASKVLPRIVSASYLYSRFPSEVGWAELQRMGDLKSFALNSSPSDIQQFASPKEEAESILLGKFSVRKQASQTSDWFNKTATKILFYVDQAEKSISEKPSNEYISTITDLKILAHLGMYHSFRLKAAVDYNLYVKTGDLHSFDKAIEYESQAVGAYGKIVEAAGDIYSMHLDFGSKEELFPGHWKDEHQKLVNELKQLKESRKEILQNNDRKPLFAHIPEQRTLVGDSIVIVATIRPENHIKSAQLMFVTEGNNTFNTIEMHISEEGICSAKIPDSGKEGILKYYLIFVDTNEKTYYIPKKGVNSPFQVIVSNDRQGPSIELERIATAKLNEKLKVSAKAEDVSGIQRITLRFRRVTQFEDYQSEEMIFNPSTEKYEATIPAHLLDGKYDVMYFVEALDTKGNGKMYPNMELETPYVIVQLDRLEK
jgi:hypothetical protein